MTNRIILLRVFFCATASLTFTLESDASPIAPISAVSRKAHGYSGSFDIPLPLTGTAGIECRSGGGSGDYQFVITFAQPITFSAANVSAGIGSVTSANTNGSEVTVNLTGVSNDQRLAVTLNGVTDGTTANDVVVGMNALIGDTNADGFVDSIDTSQVKSQSGRPVGSTNFREDLNVDGFLDAVDVAFVKSKSGSAIPCSEPVLFIISGDSQSAAVNTFLSEPLTAQVTCETGDLLVNVPLTFTTDHGAFYDSSGGQTFAQLTLYTNQIGLANVYFLTPGQPGVSTIAATAEFNGATDSIHFNETTLEPTVTSSGLKLRLRADTGITKDANNLVSRWADQSGNGNDAVQAILGNSPVFVADGLVGKPVLRFNGSTAAMNGSLSLGTQVSIFVVAARGTTNPLSKVILTNSGHFYFGTDDSGDFTTRYGNGSLTGGGSHPFILPPKQFNFLEAMNDGTDKAYVNGQLIDSRPATMGAFSSGFELGRDPLGSLYWDGDIIEVLVYDHALSDADRQSVETYLDWKYNGDTDGDGMPDLWELKYGLNPEVNDANGDLDGDGRTNLQEYLVGTDPLDYYNGGIPLPRLHVRNRGGAKGKVGFPTFRVSTPPRFFLLQTETSSIDGGNPESQVGGVITTTVDNLDTGHTSENRTGSPFSLINAYAPWGPTSSYSETTFTTVLHTQDVNENFDGGTMGAYDDPPNQVEDLSATLIDETSLTNEYTTEMLINRALGNMPALPAIDAPIDSGADDALLAQVTVFANETRAYASHSEYRFEWHMNPSLPALHQVTWQETWTPKSGTTITTVRHWEGTENQTPIYYLEPAGEGRFGVTYFAAQMMVDGNRDGKIWVYDQTVYGPDQTSQSKPYRFWLNDDDDTELRYDEGGQPFPAETEQVPPNQADSSKHQIVSKRNLEDYFRLWINLGGVESALTSGQVKIALKWKTADSGTPAINLYPSADGEGSDNYLRDEDAAAAQITGVFNNAISSANNNQTVDTSGLFIFKPDYWNGLDGNGGKKCLLFEGVSEGKGELQVVFLDSSGNRIGEGDSVWLDLANVKKMYERKEGYFPDYHSPYSQVPYNGNATANRDVDSIAFVQPVDEQDAVTVFIHGIHGPGFDQSESLILARFYATTETVFKRLWWQGYKGRFASYKWAALQAAVPFEFNESEYRGWEFGDGLADFVNGIPKTQKNVIAHSQGNALCSYALKWGLLTIKNYVAMQAAVPAGSYDPSPEINSYQQFLDAENDHGQTPDDFSQFGYRGYLSALSVTDQIVNFENPNDYALATGIQWGIAANWEANEINYKPQTLADRAYYYDPNALEPLRLVVPGSGALIRTVDDHRECLGFLARPRSQALGAVGSVQGQFTLNVDLSGPPYNFSPDASDHSGQFERRIQSVWDFYVTLTSALN